MSDEEEGFEEVRGPPKRRKAPSGEEAVRRALAEATPASQPALIKNAEGGLRACLANAHLILSGRTFEEHGIAYNPMHGVLAWDDFAGRCVKLAPPPWHRAGDRLPAPWEPADDMAAANWLQHRGCMVKPRDAAQAAELAARDKRFHPVRDFLDGLEWDGIERLDEWLHDRLGVVIADPPRDESASREEMRERLDECEARRRLVRAIGSRWMISAVARVYQPGCKADCVLILEGAQGVLKSTALRVLGGDWYTDEFPDLGSKDASLQAAGVWIIELAELDSLARPEASKIKAFISRTADRFRPPYGERVVEWQRQCVFAGTSNATWGYLKDETGGRRFWPVRVGEIDIAGLQRARAQLWAEAVARYRKGEAWWLDTPELRAAASEAQADRYEGDAWEDLIEGFVKTTRATRGVTRADIYELLGIPKDRWDRSADMRIARCLKALGCTQRRSGADGKGPRVYVPPTPPTSPDVGGAET